MRQRLDLESYQKRFQERKIRGEKILNQTKGPKLLFLSHQPNPEKKLLKMEKFLEHLKNYEKNTQDLIKECPENADFYNDHLQNVIDLLENIENRYPDESKLEGKYFILKVPNADLYKKTNSDTIETIFAFCQIGATLGGAIVGAITAIVGAVLAIVALSTSGAAFFPPGAGLFVGLLAAIGGLLGFVVGGAIGGFLGLLVGLVASTCIDKPLNNAYLNNRAFDCELLKEAYAEALNLKIDSSNDMVNKDEDLASSQMNTLNI
ncbi:MAG: hypothetical protein H0T84_12685 [Tatlockia sp.]|nr:hypothetical protein [Tatlockia sp.]